MNYYGTEKHKEDMKKLDEQIFSKIRFDKPEREKELESGYIVRYYYYADEEKKGCSFEQPFNFYVGPGESYLCALR